MPTFGLGESIPPDTSHVSADTLCILCVELTFYHSKAVSVSLPTWKANIDYEEGKESVHGILSTGYPRLVT